MSSFSSRHLAVRLGFRQAKGLGAEEVQRLLAARGDDYHSTEQLWRRAGLAARTLARLAEADGFRSLGLDRRQALWAVRGLGEAPLPLFATGNATGNPEPETGDLAALPAMPLSQHVIEDYRSLQLTLKRHPLAFLRAGLARRGIVPNDRLALARNGQKVLVGGLVLVRQRPGTASGVIFMTLEDETGIANLVVWSHMFQKYRRTVMASKLIGCAGKLQIEGQKPHQVIHVVAERLFDLTPMLDTLREENAPPQSHGGETAAFPIPFAHADEVKRDHARPESRAPKVYPNMSSGSPPLAAPLLDIRSRDFH
jgi:error-prone DNA polymerase